MNSGQDIAIHSGHRKMIIYPDSNLLTYDKQFHINNCQIKLDINKTLLK